MVSKILILVISFFAYSLEANEGVADVNDSYYLSIKDDSTASTYLKVNLKDVDTKQYINLVVENTLFSAFMMEYKKITFGEYVTYMMDHKGYEVAIKIDFFKDYLLKQLGSIKNVEKYLSENSYVEEYSLSKFGADNISQFLDEYFVFKNKYENGYFKHDIKSINPYEPEFIAMLIDSGCLVRRGDAIPFLMVSC